MFGSKFSNKCKQAAKCIRTRVEPIKKKKQATLRFLKKDVADLLAAGHDDNAFRRIDSLIVEINHVSCYETIERCCEYIVRQIPTLEKQRECSKEVIQVMGTLIFAAARFPDLPELCDLRHIFMERYGNDMQSSANAEFVEKIQNKTFSKESKLQLMKIIAEEFSIRWDSQLFEHKLSNPPASKSDPTEKVVPSNTNDEPPSTVVNGMKEVLPSRDKLEHTPASLPRRQEMPREAKVVQVISTSKNKPENVEQYARHTEVPLLVGSRSSYNVAHQEDDPKDIIQHRRVKVQVELNTVCQEKQGLGTIKYWDHKPTKLVPPYTKSSGNDNGNDIEVTKGNGMRQYAKSDDAKNLYPVKENNESMLESVQLGNHEERQEPPWHGLNSVQPVNNNVRMVNLIPPYVKPKVTQIIQEDPSIRNFNVASYDNSKDIDDRDDKMSRYYIGKPKPFSVRRNHGNLPAVETLNTPVNEEKPDSYVNGGRRRISTNKQSAIIYEENISTKNNIQAINDELTRAVGNGILMPQPSRPANEEKPDSYVNGGGGRGISMNKQSAIIYEGNISTKNNVLAINDELTRAVGNGILMPQPSKPVNEEKPDSYVNGRQRISMNKQSAIIYEENISTKNNIQAINGELARAVGNGILMPQPSRRQRKEGNKHLADGYDRKFDETNICKEKPNYHVSGDRRYKVEQNTVVHDEWKTLTRNSKLSVDEDETDNAIDYGNLFARASNGQRRHGIRWTTAVYDGDYDEEEIAIDRLLVHYSRKGTNRDPGKERKNGIPDANELPCNDEVHYRRKELNRHLERALSMPAEPAGPKTKAPARTLSMKPDVLAPNCGRVHPRLPDYDHLAARLAALRET